MVGQYQTYPEYKESGVEYLNEIPSHWMALPMHSLVTECDRSNKGMVENNLLSLSYGRIIQKNIHTLDGLLPASFETYQIVKPNDIVFRLTDLQNDKRSLRSAIVNERGIITSAYTAVKPIKLNPAYFSWLMRSYDTWKVFYGMGGGLRQSLRFDELKRLPIAAPYPEEQRQIARFLDHETTRIDQLIAKQERLIELLKEKRQAVISHAVTKGLDPNAPMKESGVEWLGEVPEGWGIRSVSRSSNKITNGYVGPTRNILVDKGTPYIQATHIKNGVVNFDGAYFVRQNWSRAHSKSILAKDDVLIVQTGAGTGDIGLVSGNEVGFNCHALIIVEPNEEVITGRFLSMVLQSQYGYSKLYSIRTGGMHPHLNCGEVQYVKLPIPPISEQNSIIKLIHEKASTLDFLVSKQIDAIRLMKERRTALISAAVTGKIDVRDWEPPTSNKDAA